MDEHSKLRLAIPCGALVSGHQSEAEWSQDRRRTRAQRGLQESAAAATLRHHMGTTVVCGDSAVKPGCAPTSSRLRRLTWRSASFRLRTYVLPCGNHCITF